MSSMNWAAGELSGENVLRTVKRIRDLDGIFRNTEALRSIDPDLIVYSVEWEEKPLQGTEGGLFWGSTTIEPGQVGDEYFMTRGHFHAKRDRCEYYTTVQGTGMLVLMNETREGRVEIMSPGSLHYIPGYTAHRTVNTGDTPLIFWACWPSDAGHDYASIEKDHFSIRVIRRNGSPHIA
jgi:glucose-6-phosphate isomerase